MSSKKFLQLFEMPVGRFDLQGDWNPDTKIGNLDPYADEDDGGSYGAYDRKTVKNMRDAIPKIRKRFDNINHTFDFIMLREQPQHDGDSRYVEYGAIDDNDDSGVAAKNRFRQIWDEADPDAITVVFTNNTGDDLVSIAKEWNFSHRLAHVFQAAARKNQKGLAYTMSEMEACVHELLGYLCDNVYGITNPFKKVRMYDGNISHNWIYEQEELAGALLTAVGKQHFISCQKGRLARPFEFVYEAFACMVKYGEIRFSDPIGPALIDKPEPDGDWERKSEFMTYPPMDEDHPDYDPEYPDEPDYDEEPEFDEEAYNASFYRQPQRGMFYQDDLHSYARTLEYYWDELLSQATGSIFIM